MFHGMDDVAVRFSLGAVMAAPPRYGAGLSPSCARRRRMNFESVLGRRGGLRRPGSEPRTRHVVNTVPGVFGLPRNVDADLAITGMETAAIISRIFFGDAIAPRRPRRDLRRTRSSAITETAPAFSAITACSALVTS